MGYGASAGHSAWRGTRDNILAIALIALVLTAVLGPLYFVYKTGRALLERQDEGESRAARILWFGLGTTLSALYMGWVLFMGCALLVGSGAAGHVPGAAIIPARASEAVVHNAENSFVRLVKLLGGGDGDKGERKPWNRAAPGGDGIELAGNLAARTYLAIFAAGLAAGYRQRRESDGREAVIRQNMAFFDAFGLDLADDGTITDETGQTYRIEERGPGRITLMALHRRNMRGYIDLAPDGRMTAWSGLVRRGTA